MSTTTNDTSIAISQTNSGFPDYLDFDKMRSDVINYLGPITSAYWTDYNEHDPGITTLEALLYALMDLGYRANWPIADLLTQKTGVSETDFLTPAQVLGSNPFTINDYRKRLMDLKEVRNAWLTPATDQPVKGLYQVQLELESDVSDFSTEAEYDKYAAEVVAAVVRVLQAHRNLCEDFLAPTVMKKKSYFVTADIELKPGASIQQVYADLLKGLYQFFSPVPTYYTLVQLLAKNVSLDQVFAGRPYEHRPSYGFVLDNDLPNLPGNGTRKIYASQVLDVLLGVPGIDAVKGLNVAPVSDGTSNTGSGFGTTVWELSLDAGTLPVLSVAGSTFHWFLNGQQLTWSSGTTAAQWQKMLAYSGKVLYPFGSPALDNGVPAGRYLDGLENYYSIQKDFPEVYGIGPGGLPASASVKRKAQAMQFKGYLLFFEQLMADFLVRLGNVRSLLSMQGVAGSPPRPDEDDDPEDRIGSGPDIDPQGGLTGTGGGQTTSWHGDLSDVPDLNDLLLFPPGAESTLSLAFPVDAHEWNELVRKGPVSCDDVEKLKPFTFKHWHDRDLAVAELTLSFTVMPPTSGVLVLEGGKKSVFVISGIRSDFVLLSASMYDTPSDASGAAGSAIYAGGSKEFYSLSVIADENRARYSFSLGQSGLDYYDYVDKLTANPQLDVQQRSGFLLHLIDRFAESYTDYARLSAGFLSTQTIATNQAGLMQQFLTDLPTLGADRDRAYNYTRPSWDNNNVSGFEQRFKAYCGIADRRRHFLCPFEVVPAERQYLLQPVLGDETLMTGGGSFTETSGFAAARELYTQMSSAANYQMTRHESAIHFRIDLRSGDSFESVRSWSDTQEANAALDRLVRMLELHPRNEDIRVHRAEYRAEVVNADDRVVRTGRDTYTDEQSGFEDAAKKIHGLKEEKFWEIPPGMENEPGRLERSRDKGSHRYLDTKGLEMPIKHDIPHKPEHCRFIVADEAGRFSFAGTQHLPTSTEGRAAARAFLFLLTDEANYRLHADRGGFRLNVIFEDAIIATEQSLFGTEAQAFSLMQDVIRFLSSRMYTLKLKQSPIEWRFQFQLGLPGTRNYLFLSTKPYTLEAAARDAARNFYAAVDTGWELSKDKKGFHLEASGGESGSVTCTLEMQEGMPTGDELENDLQRLVVAKSTVLSLAAGNREAVDAWLQPDQQIPGNGFLYRLVDKDRPRGYHETPQADKTAAERARSELMARGRLGYIYPDICVEGENIVQKQDGYHYRIRCCNDYFYQLYFHRFGLADRDKEWTLFESIAVYSSADAAQQAFNDNYLQILEKAGERVNFGERDTIAWDEHGRRKAVVYVSEELRNALERAGENVAETLVKAARAYPIRSSEKGKQFHFQLTNDKGERDWVSAGRFAGTQDANDAFNYFLLLLRVSGNYFIDYDVETCHYRVGIREALAESVNGFATEDEAWGPDGVQRFIGVAQTRGGWHPEKRDKCDWGYFVACPNEQAIHPCRYETAYERDAALEHLYAAAQGFPATEWITSGENESRLSDPLDGSSIAVIPAIGDTVLSTVLDLLDAVWTGLFYEDDHGLYIQAGQVVIRPADPGVGRDKWENDLLRFAAYFPIVRTTTVGTAAQFRVEIKLPGFAALPGRSLAARNCGCGQDEQEREPQPACYAAWISTNTIPGAAEAWEAYKAVLPLLTNKNNYRAVHDAEALLFGIELLEEPSILAHTIQHYWYPKMAARGLDRAKACVNAEGLDLVEHLLLRKEIIPICQPNDNAPLDPPQTSPAQVAPATVNTTQSGQGFQPGADPYSFVMTIFLPAWPERFRKSENRQLLESILQREAPAHVLPRILWLTPKDMCRMETSYKKWLHSLCAKKPCAEFQPNELIGLLFNTSFECMENAGCKTLSKKEPADDWLSQINKLYCWSDSECADTSGWSSGSGNPGGQGKIPFVMGGTKLKRPTAHPVPEKPGKGRRPTYPTRPPRDQPTQPSIWTRLMKKLEKLLEDLWEILEGVWDKLGGWGTQVLRWARIK